MKSKRNTYFLLTAAIGIWSYVVYVIVSNINLGDNPVAKVTLTKPVFSTLEADTFQLLLSYKDPFLKVQPSSKRITSPVKPLSKPVINHPSEQEKIKWPEVRFLGGIRNHSTGGEVFMLQVAGADYMVQAGDVVQGISVLAVNAQEITLVYKEQTKIISK